MARLTRRSLLALASVLTPAVALGPDPVVAVAPSAYTVPAGVEVVEVVVAGGRGGSATQFVTNGGGAGCRVTTPLAVASGDSVTWLLGGDGGSTVAMANATMGGQGGTGARLGGNGGNLTANDGRGVAGAGGGGASAAYLNGVEIIVAAGGGGASRLAGGSGCPLSASGANGLGSTPVAQGASSPSAGGAGGTGTDGNSARPGQAGNSASGNPAGRGGDGAISSVASGVSGGGGGGGISGGGGGAASWNVGTSGGQGSGTGAAGLSGVTTSVTQPGFALPVYQTAGAGPSFLAINAVEILTNELPAGTVGTAYSATLDAAFVEAFTTASGAGTPSGDLTWSLATGSASLPAGLSLVTTGAITGTPTSPGAVTVTFEASVLDGSQLLRARSLVTLDVVVSAPAVSPAESLVTTPLNASTTTPPSPSVAPSTSAPAPTTTVAPASGIPTPVSVDGALPELPVGEVLVVEDGEPTEVNVFTEDDTMVLENDRFRLRLSGDCSRDDCTIATTDEGREVLTLEEAGRANVEGLGFLPGSIVDIWLFSEPRYLGSLTVAADGTFMGDVDLLNIAVGEHTLQVNGISRSGAQRSANLGVIVNPTTVELPATGAGTHDALPIALLVLTGGLVVLASRRRLTA